MSKTKSLSTAEGAEWLTANPHIDKRDKRILRAYPLRYGKAGFLSITNQTP